jgi:hypothetical protein
MELAVDRQTANIITGVLGELSPTERRILETEVVAIADRELVTAVRPFMFGGMVVHELYLDSAKLLFYTTREKIGAIVSAFIIVLLSRKGNVPFSDQSLRTHAKQINRYGKRLKYGDEVTAFLRRVTNLEDEWRKHSL